MQTRSFTSGSNNGLLNVLPCKVGIRPATVTNPKYGKQPATIWAIWDTGATSSAITPKIAKALGLAPIRVTEVHTAGGTRKCNVYVVDLLLPNRVGVAGVEVTEADMPTSDALIGMDIICLGDFAVTNFEGKTCFSFRIPSMRKIDFVKEDQQQKPPKPGATKARTRRKQERENKKQGRRRKN